MSPESVWGVLVLMGLGAFALRYTMLALWGRWSIPPLLQRALRYVPAAVLSALVWKGVVNYGGTYHWGLDNDRLWAGLAAAVVAWRSKSIVLTIAVGMAVLWVLAAI